MTNHSAAPAAEDKDDEEIETGSNAQVESQGNAATAEETKEGYWCVICGRFLEAEVHESGNLIVHDDVPHPIEMNFGDERNPQ